MKRLDRDATCRRCTAQNDKWIRRLILNAAGVLLLARAVPLWERAYAAFGICPAMPLALRFRANEYAFFKIWEVTLYNNEEINILRFSQISA